MIKLLLATNNQGKLAELRSLLDGLDLELVTPADLGLNLQIKETGESYQENAILKAAGFAKASNLWSLADDTGLEVEALDGAPGLYSARYAPQPDATDRDRRLVLLHNLEEKPQPWKALFRCVVALCGPDGSTITKDGTCPGEIIPDERGEGGFGYDPVFLLEVLQVTMAELSLVDKNNLSHRSRAVWKMIPALKELSSQGRIKG
ncbi:MAG: RdgB/HAM1 family non-canonical purine NTP pyrophosphatase [Anaerolineales bacterium]|nr:RdgB/HAM1 family non-canonical purine NTP pyrophosphatase [Anaerolineales bacterium]